MADIVIVTATTLLDGIALKAAGLVAATAAHTEVRTGRGAFCIQIDWTAAEIASNDEFYKVTVEANSLAAASTWSEIAVLLCHGATEVQASSGDLTATGSIRIGVRNPNDDKIRLKTWVSGAVATGFNYSAKLYPIELLSAF